MVNGLRVNISEIDFKAMPVADQNWKLYLAITKIDEYGCSYAIKRYKDSLWKKLSVIGAGFGGGFGFSIMVGKAFRWW